MARTQTSKSTEIRARLDHPVIDADGHMIEFEAGVADYIDKVGGLRLVDRFNSWGAENLFKWSRLSPKERLEKRATRGVWWGMPTKNTLDRATASLPALLYERLNDFGVDFAGMTTAKLRTRSGKIMRRVLHAQALSEPLGDLSTMEE